MGVKTIRRKTPKEFEDEVEELVGKKYTILSEYQTSRKKVKVRHNICGNEYLVEANGFLQGNRCPNCNGNGAKQKTTEQFAKEVEELVGDEYTLLGEYINRSTNIKIRHNTCGREYQVEPGNFLNGSRCIECYYQSMRLSDEAVDKYLSECLGDRYQRVGGKYISMQHNITIKHLTCGNEYRARLTDIVQKRIKCPRCSSSLGEQLVDEVLTSYGIEFKTQKTFEGLVNINSLYYDFYIPGSNIVIEYQGEQHYRPKNFGGASKEEALENYKKQVLRDNIKREYATKKGLTLIEIPYTVKTKPDINRYIKSNVIPIVSNIEDPKPKNRIKI